MKAYLMHIHTFHYIHVPNISITNNTIDRHMLRTFITTNTIMSSKSSHFPLLLQETQQHTPHMAR